MYSLTLKQKINLNSLYDRIDSRVMTLFIRGSTSKEPVRFEERGKKELKPYQLGDCWGE